jgi:lipoprotein-anchoring transpeptidase ErfK/SrfK
MRSLLIAKILMTLAVAGPATLAGKVMLAESPSPAPIAAPSAAETPASPATAARPVVAREAAEQPAVAPSPVAERSFVIKRILPIKGPMKYGDWYWNDADVPAGPIVVTVDLDARVLSVFRDGYEIGATVVLIGFGDHPTPTGVFPIMEKERHHLSSLYYSAPMPYMQRLTSDGVTLHATKVEWGYASHGCIGMPEPFAAKLFKTTKVGDKVYITRGKMVGLGDSLVGA